MIAPRSRIRVQDWNAVPVLDFGTSEYWDYADLLLLRERMTELIEQGRYRHLGLNMQFVRYVPSGFFGMLYEWVLSGITIQLHAPRFEIRQMRWFRQFCVLESEDTYRLTVGTPSRFSASEESERATSSG